MKKYDFVLLTDSRYVHPKDINTYIRSILDEDLLVIKALENKGMSVIRVDWADENFDWSSAKTAIFRTTWDYFDRFDEFISWINNTKSQLSFINSVELILWNIDKHYMQDLAAQGVNIPETRFIESGEQISLNEILSATGWNDAILKPAISASARHTYRINPGNCSKLESVYQSLIQTEAMLLQPFQNSVLERGEIALMFFEGKYSHAILKTAKKGDFRVQSEFGGTVQDHIPTQAEITLGEQVLQACNSMPVYARVDIIEDNNGILAVAELELIEPELWFRYTPEAAESFADAVIKYLSTI